MEEIVLKGSLIGRLDWPGKLGIIYVGDLADFIYKVSLKKPVSGHIELYIPAIEALTIAEMFEAVYKAYELAYKPYKVLPQFWQICQFFARRKRFFEPFFPHRLYNRIWQACLMVNSEFYNKGRRIREVLGTREPKYFSDYYREKVQRTQR